MSAGFLRKASIALALLALFPTVGLHAATANRVLTQVTNESRTVVPQNVPARARLATDLGAADPALPLTSMTLRFSLSDAGQAALTELLLEQQQPSSPNYHQWLTPEQFGARFGLSSADLAKVTAWLTSQGFTVTGAARGATFVTFSGTAGQVQQAFATTIHRVTLNGEAHFTNLTDPSVPAALAGVVSSVTGLHDFKLAPRSKVRVDPPATSNAAHPDYTTATGANNIAPGDFYTIYDEAPLLASSINGAGITIAVMGQTDINLADLAAFRAAAGLSVNAPTVKLVGSTDPGVSSNDLGEAELDLEWAGAGAPGASILYVNSTDVINLSLTQAIDSNLAPIITVSYGDCEAAFGLSSLQSFNVLFQQANAQGITIVGPGGDSGAADCDYNVRSASDGLAVDFPASSPYVTGVGGTMFNEGTGTYFSPTNGTNGGSATSYIPEAVWNESVAYGSLAAGGGGASAFFTKPAWQVGTGVPADFSRDVPDLAMNAAVEHDGYVYCTNGSCVNGFLKASGTPTVVGGTSVPTPIFAGILALVEQKIGSRIGNANPTIYALANSTYAANVFHDVASGSNTVSCVAGTPSCATSGTGNVIGYNATAGYDRATGWGSIDAYNLVNDWKLVTPIGTTAGQNASTTTITSPTTAATVGATFTFTANVVSASSNASASPTGTVQLLVDGVASGSAVALSNGTATLTLASGSLTSGTHTVNAAYSGDTTYTGSKGSITIDLTSAASPDFSLTGSSGTLAVTSGGNAAVTYTLTSLNGFVGSVSLVATTNASVNASANFSVTPVALTSGATGTSVFTFYAFTSSGATSPATLSSQRPSAQAGLRPLRLAGGGTAFAVLFLVLLPGRRRATRMVGIFSVLLLSLGAAGITGCSSAGSTVATTPTTVNSAKGSYPITITATYGSIVHTATLTVVVQ